MNKRGLGKGLGALLPPDFELKEKSQKGVTELRVDEIVPNIDQPRRVFEEDKLDELAASIEEVGIVQPIVVRLLETGVYQIVAGERRWRAAQQLGMDKVPVIVKEVNEKEILEIALIENIQREDLNPIEEARTYNILIEEHKLTQEKLAGRIGKSRSFIANTLRLLNLALPIQRLLEEGKISAGHARALLPLPEKEQLLLAEKIQIESISVRETERLAKKLLEKKEDKKQEEIEEKTEKQYYWDKDFITEYQDKLREILGTKVEINQVGEQGKIVIEYYSPGDLQRVLELFLDEETI